VKLLANQNREPELNLKILDWMDETDCLFKVVEVEIPKTSPDAFHLAKII